MYGIEACPCKGHGPQKQWGLWYQCKSFLPAEVHGIDLATPYEEIIIKEFLNYYKKKMSHKYIYIYILICNVKVNKHICIHINTVFPSNET